MSPFQKARPTLTSADLNRTRQIGQRAPVPTGAPLTYGFTTQATRPRVAQPARPVAPVAQPALEDLTGFARENAAANAQIYQPGSFGAANAVANNTGRPYTPPQQTERANPLTGDSSRQVPGTTASVRSPFSMRGSSTPNGDDTVAGSMQGTLSRLRSFNRPQAQTPQYPGFLTRAMQGG